LHNEFVDEDFSKEKNILQLNLPFNQFSLTPVR
jgi:hypothetical protein